MAEELDFRKLRYVVRVAQTKSVTAAADTLAITQPALSRCISQMEAELGVRIFQRLPRGVVLTEEGESFVSRAKTILADLDALGEDFKGGQFEARRRLRFGVAPGTYLPLVAPAFGNFASTYPEVAIETVSGKPQDLVPKLGTGELDLVLSSSEHLARWQDIDSEELATLWFAYMFRKGHPIAKQKKLGAKEILANPVILPATLDWMYLDLEKMHRANDMPAFKPQYITDDLTVAFSLISKTNAYWPLLTTSASMDRLSKDFKLVKVGELRPRRYLCLAYSSSRPRSPLADMMISTIRDTDI